MKNNLKVLFGYNENFYYNDVAGIKILPLKYNFQNIIAFIFH